MELMEPIENTGMGQSPHGTKPSLQTSTRDPLHQISTRVLNHSSSDLEWIWCDPCMWPIEMTDDLSHGVVWTMWEYWDGSVTTWDKAITSNKYSRLYWRPSTPDLYKGSQSQQLWSRVNMMWPLYVTHWNDWWLVSWSCLNHVGILGWVCYHMGQSHHFKQVLETVLETLYTRSLQGLSITTALI